MKINQKLTLLHKTWRNRVWSSFTLSGECVSHADWFILKKWKIKNER